MIDLNYLKDITDNDADSMRQLINLFFAQADEIMERFRSAQAAGDVEEIGRIAHLAKSTSKVMGINHVSEKMQELQLLVDRHQQSERYNELVEFYMSEMPISIKELKEVLEKL